ncbi:enoyl-CoA hydratase-related protein [Shimia marina]|uniref:Fatty acid oxidation complex subunit alpha n=1 Tax=Shimia marina TaxID=321267 RepID=A0A0P1FEI4_9RHOB|nr:enoyl-CoA hydratase-related protein [Shimia marina]CUH52730.1 Fatty acid oxidation complex subunit alpha [Shimia marina]SFE79714.1 3-hydroxyacyl-CoA dehydrogenase [Shimia marina]
MSQLLNYTVEGGVAILSMNNPPSNALTAPLRAEILAALTDALDDKMVGAVVLRGVGETFSGGRDYSELGKPIATPTLWELCDAIELAPKPVVAALSGVVLGAGVELALACHYRVVDRQTKLAMPEVALGVTPGAGGTQRAPRLLGAQTTLELLLSGALKPAAAPEMAGMVDEIAQEDVGEAAILFALRCIAQYRSPRPTRDVSEGFADYAAFNAAVTHWQGRIPTQGQEAAEAILESVQAAPVLPFEVAQSFERERFEAIVKGEQCRALQHVALAERRASRAPEVRNAAPRKVQKLGLVAGRARLGADIALAALKAGLHVIVSAESRPALEIAGKRIASMLERQVTQGHWQPARRDEVMRALTLSPDLVALQDADMVIEAVGLGPEVSRQILTQLDAIVEDRTVLAVHDPAAQLDQLGQAIGMAEDLVGLYIPNLHLRTASCEVAVGGASGAEAVATSFAAMSKLGYMPLRTAAHAGGLGQTVVGACVRAAEDLLRLGANPYEIDRVMRQWGMARGPFQLADAIGLNAQGLRAADAGFCRVLYKLAREGRDSRLGWYRYDAAHPMGAEDPDTLRVVEAVLREDPQPVAKMGITGADIERSLLAAMANAGARLLRLGVAGKPSDIDVALIHGFGFPRWRGGPMHVADSYGLIAMRAHLRAMAMHGAAIWQPEPLFDTLIKNGRGFGALSG